MYLAAINDSLDANLCKNFNETQQNSILANIQPCQSYRLKLKALSHSITNNCKVLTVLIPLFSSLLTFGQAPNIPHDNPDAYTSDQKIAPLSPLNTGGSVFAVSNVTTIASNLDDYPQGIAVNDERNIYITNANSSVTKITHDGTRSTGITTLNIQAMMANQPPSITYNSPQIYKVGQPVTPLSPVNTGGAVPSNVSGSATIMAGNGGFRIQDGTGTTAGFGVPTAVTTDQLGNLYVVDQVGAIRKVTAAGVVTTIAGDGTPGASFPFQQEINGTGKAAKFNYPSGVVIDSDGNLLIAEYGRGLIRKITPAGVVTTFVKLNSGPKSIAIDANNNIYVTQPNGHQMQKITPEGIVITFGASGTAGTNAVGGLTDPNSVAVDAAGNLYIIDGETLIKKVTPSGIMTTLAVSSQPLGNIGYNALVVDPSSGVLYAILRDDVSHIEEISPDGIISLIDIIPPPNYGASYYKYFGMAYFAGKLFIADYSSEDGYGNYIRQVDLTGYSIDKTLPAGMTFDIRTGVISGTPTVASPATDYLITARNTVGKSTTAVNIEVKAPLKPAIITFLPPVKIEIGSDNILRPIVSSNNSETPITYSSSNPLVAYVGADGLIHVIAPGTTEITASQAGNDNFLPATPVSQTFNITQQQLLLFPAIAPKLICDADFDAGAVSSNSLLPMLYSSSNPSVAIISSTGLIHILASGTTNITVSQPGNNLYTVAIPSSQVLTVAIPVIPLVTILPDRNQICIGTPLVFTATVSNLSANLLYQWKLNGKSVGTNSPTFETITYQTGDVMQCVVTNAASCNATGTSNSYSGVIVNNYVTPSVSIKSSIGASVCSGTTITYTAQPANGGTDPIYQWKVNGVNAGGNSETFAADNFANGDLVTCTLTRKIGDCLAISTVTSNTMVVSIIPPANPTPSVIITASANNVFTGMLIKFTAAASDAGTVTSYQWQVNGSNVSSGTAFSSSKLKNKDAVTCVITSDIPCTTPVISPALVMDLLPPLSIQVVNTFTPNGDGINDTWNIPALSSFPNCALSVFDRYGKQVFYSSGYSRAWDGTLAGRPLPYATYYYVIDLGYKGQKLSGSVTIVR